LIALDAPLGEPIPALVGGAPQLAVSPAATEPQPDPTSLELALGPAPPAEDVDTAEQAIVEPETTEEPS
jgi:hypothetical protein